MNFGLVVLGLMVVFWGRSFWKVKKAGGMRAALVGGRIQSTLGQVTPNPVAGTMELFVHRIAGEDHREVAIEIKQRAGASWSRMSIPLSAQDAQQLAELLQQAALLDSGPPTL